MAHFFDLPAELRNEIYRLVFLPRKSIVISKPRRRPAKRGQPSCRQPPSSLFAANRAGLSNNDRQMARSLRVCHADGEQANYGLLHVNRQLRAETKLLFYSNVDFIVETAGVFVAWSATLEPKLRNAIGQVVVRGYLRHRANREEIMAMIYSEETRSGKSMSAESLAFDRTQVELELWSLEGGKAWPYDSIQWW